ncbi:alcohol dehydrogenase catalytic domain-containing protein [Streptomyces phaeochromogenes]|uniref:alcohol dehydrogenase catalytic domain-containing protein n=1 Tax=Streptomyces phaeochromogenes TaxID=1923 RepID=UPI002DD9E500|nr:alcohol dehydrogenase catalytic domain-containing protein [Streptomyces phaeochromogenes]WRZ35843.1 alcohol dehydrogenase catalytic domain-containing protein [Streptomyces phaeochromogenes]
MAVGVNRVDQSVRRGWLHCLFPVTFPFTLGSEAVGIVDWAGEGVTDISVGEGELAPAWRAGFMEASYAQWYVLYEAAVAWRACRSSSSRRRPPLITMLCGT